MDVPFVVPNGAAVVSECLRTAHSDYRHFIVTFPNGYSGSVISRPGSGGERWEVAVMQDGHLVYTTPITTDVIGWISTQEVESILARIAGLEGIRP